METSHRPSVRPVPPARLVEDTGIRFAIGTGLVVLTLFVAGLSGLGTSETAAAAILVAGLASPRLSMRTALVLGAIAWAFFTGFFENTYGQLSFAAGDLQRLGVFTVATVAVSALAGLVLPDRSEPTRG